MFDFVAIKVTNNETKKKIKTIGKVTEPEKPQRFSFFFLTSITLSDYYFERNVP